MFWQAALYKKAPPSEADCLLLALELLYVWRAFYTCSEAVLNRILSGESEFLVVLGHTQNRDVDKLQDVDKLVHISYCTVCNLLVREQTQMLAFLIFFHYSFRGV